MASNDNRMDGFSDCERIQALKRAKSKLEADLEIFKQEEVDAFKLVDKLDEELKLNKSPELEERRRQKLNWAQSLKWNIFGQEKEIKLCEEAIVREERISNISSEQ